MSRIRVRRPPAVRFTMMSANSSGSTSRPFVLRVIWIDCPLPIGGWPTCPVGHGRFCSRIAVTTSPAVMLRAASFSGSTQTRML